MKNLFQSSKPQHFNSTMEVAGCYCVYQNKVLFLKRHIKKPYGETWGVPAGKLEINELPREAVIREIYEEIGLNINDAALKYIGTLYCRIPELDFTYHLFTKAFYALPKIKLAADEHTDFKWVTYEEALQLPLIIGGAEALTYFLSHQAE